VSENQRFLVYADGRPFFYLGDTAWELLHRLDREETERYLLNRASRGFTVIQTVALAELDGLRTPNAYGHVPFINLDVARPNEPYWQHVDWVVRRANTYGIFVGLLPTWGDKWNRKWGEGPEVFNCDNARAYGEWLGRRCATNDVIWILGGDRPLETEPHWAIIRAMAAGIGEGDGGRGLISYHPGGGQRFVTTLHREPWLDFTMIQSGHTQNGLENYRRIRELWSLTPVKPVMDAEPCYEAHLVMTPEWRPFHNLRYNDFHARRAAWWSVLSGACGHTYGAHAIWQMWDVERFPVNSPAAPWYEEVDLPGSSQLQHLSKLILSKPYFSRVPADEMVMEQPPTSFEHIVAARDAAGSYALVYAPVGGVFRLSLSSLTGDELRAAWFDPRLGTVVRTLQVKRANDVTFEPPMSGMDWVLIIDVTKTSPAAL